jgi:HK97 gp10 family phage protein
MSNPVPTGVKVRGFNQAVRALRAVGVPDSEIRDAGKDAGEIVANEARSLVPVRTGRLRDSIRVSRQLRKVTVAAGNNRKSRSGVPYANPIHWGWFRRNIKPQPFFIKALNLTREDVWKKYYENMDKLIKKQSTKGSTVD